MDIAHNITRRRALIGALASSAAIAVPAAATVNLLSRSPEERLHEAVAQVRAIMSEMTDNRFCLFFRESGSGHIGNALIFSADGRSPERIIELEA